MAVSLIYKNGKFFQGSTRGDGEIGEDITENLKMIKNIPLHLSQGQTLLEYLEVRGEVIMEKDTLLALNKKRKEQGEVLFANTRNAAAGSLRQLDSKIVQERNLDFFAYDLFMTQVGKGQTLPDLHTHSAKHKYLRELGFNLASHEVLCKNLEEVIIFIKKFEKTRPNLPYGTDGIVICVDDLKIQENLGVVGKAPRHTVAFKYPAEKATTIVKDIQMKVGRTGVLTPLAIFEPTLVAGSTVSKATLHNMDQIERLNLKIGDTVVIEKAGDVIPKVVEVLTRLRTGKEKKILIPKFCPACGEGVEKRNLNYAITQVRKGLTLPDLQASVAYYCPNSKCPAKNQRYLDHFVSVFKIYELGPKILKKFRDANLINDAADIFILKKDEIANLEGMGEKSAENILQEIEIKKKILLAKFLWALGILHVGEETARDLAASFGSIPKLATADLEEINSIENIGPVVSKSVFDYFRNQNNLNFIEKLIKNGVIIQDVPQKSRFDLKGAQRSNLDSKKLKFSGLIFVLTGTLPTMSRDLVKEKIISLGGKVSSSISKNTSYLVAGDDPGSKFALAQKLGVKIIEEKEFLKML